MHREGGGVTLIKLRVVKKSKNRVNKLKEIMQDAWALSAEMQERWTDEVKLIRAEMQLNK